MSTGTASPVTDDPEIFLAIDDLDLVGRGLADVVWHGQHQSLVRGPGVEFHSHRPYQTGDDLRRVNWSLLARHRRLYIRESLAESRRPVYLFLDASASMAVNHGQWSKLHYARRALAGVAHLALRQGDAPALHISSGVALPSRCSTDHVSGLCAELAHSSADGIADMSAELRAARAQCRRRGFILLVSDFLDQENETLAELAAFAAQGHDVFALQVLDPLEVELPESGDFDFIEPETNTRLRAAAEPIRNAYARKVANWRAGLRRQTESHNIRWHSVTTREPLVSVLRAWLT